MVYMPHWPKYFGNKDINLGLGRMEAILKQLGNPHKKTAPVIHIAGTNGKGSTLSFVKSIFEQSGYKVHAYTSPHLLDFNERIYLSGNNIDDQFLFEVIEECRIACEKLSVVPTFFETTTAAAFLAFSKVYSDIVILEVGLGGRLDATNVIDKPIMSIITSISYDHVDLLGNTLKKIAFEKAGIIKENCPCIISKQEEDIAEFLHKIAFMRNAECFSYDYDWSITKDTNKKLIYSTETENFIFGKPSLPGDHQYINAGNAICTALHLKKIFKQIDELSISKGLEKTFWPVRLQQIHSGKFINYLPNNWEFWVDGAHNEGGSRVLRAWLKDQEEIPNFLILGMTKGRDIKQFLQHFLKHEINKIYTITIEKEPSSYGAEEVSQKAIECGFEAIPCDSLEQVFYILGKDFSSYSKARVIACGSLFLAAQIINKN